MNAPTATPNLETPAPTPAPTETPAPSPTPTPEPSEPPKPLLEESKDEPAPFVALTPEDITFGEDFTVNDEYRDEFLKIVNDQELSHKDRSQALVGLYEKAAKEASEAASRTFDDQQKTWQDEVKADPDIGGAKLAPALAGINKLVSEYGSNELRDIFNVTGAGNNVHVLKFLNTIATKLTEGGPVSGGPTNVEPSAASKLFPSMKGANQ